MSVAPETVTAFNSFRAECAKDPCNVQNALNFLTQLKIAIAQFPSSMPGFPNPDQQELMLARETLELAALLSVRQKDLASFERNVTQLKGYYYDHEDLPASEKRIAIIGLYLLFLLSSDRIGEFHTELELLTPSETNEQLIAQPINLERAIMEGNYGKVAAAQKEGKKSGVDKSYLFMLDMLMDMVRSRIAQSLERAHTRLNVKTVTDWLMMSSTDELKQFVEKTNQRSKNVLRDDSMGSFGDLGDLPHESSGMLYGKVGKAGVTWKIEGDFLCFENDGSHKQAFDPFGLMVNTIEYATELERIV